MQNFPSDLLFLVNLLILVIYGNGQSGGEQWNSPMPPPDVDLEFSLAMSGGQNVGSSANAFGIGGSQTAPNPLDTGFDDFLSLANDYDDTALLETEDTLCPSRSDPMIDLTFYLYTGSESSSQDLDAMKKFISNLGKHFYMSLDPKKGLRMYAVSFASSGASTMSFGHVHSVVSLEHHLQMIKKERGKDCDLYQAIKKITKNSGRRYRSHNNYIGKAMILITNTALIPNGWNKLKNYLKNFDAVICIGILAGDYFKLEEQLNELATFNSRLGRKSLYTFNSYAELKDSELIGDVCDFIKAPDPCDQPKKPLRGTVEFNYTNVNQLAIYKCNEGYSSKSNLTRMCLKTSEWSGSVPICNTVCRLPQAPENGDMTASHNELSVGAIVTFICNKGFEFQLPLGDTSIAITSRCMKNGKWSEVTPRCAKKVIMTPTPHVTETTEDVFLFRNKEAGNIQPTSSKCNCSKKVYMRAGMNVRKNPEEKKEISDQQMLVHLGLVEAAAAAGILAAIAGLIWRKCMSKTIKQDSEETPGGLAEKEDPTNPDTAALENKISALPASSKPSQAV